MFVWFFFFIFLRATFWEKILALSFFFHLSFFCCSHFLHFAAVLSTRFCHIPSQTKAPFIWDLLVFLLLMSSIFFVFFICVSRFSWFPFSYVSCFLSDYDKYLRFPGNSGVFFFWGGGSCYLWYTTSVSCNLRDMFCSVLPPKPFFITLLCFSFFVVSSFSSLFPLKIHVLLAFINPLWDRILVLFFCSIFLAPFLSSDCSSFLETSFLTSPSRIQLAFTFGCLILLFSIFIFFIFMLGVSFFVVFPLVVFVWFSSDCCCHLSFHFWCFFVFVSVWFFVCFGCVCWFQLMTKENMGFHAVLVLVGVGLLENQFGSRCSELDNGTRFFK